VKKLKWHGMLFSMFILFMYVMGIYDMFMMLSHNVAYYESKAYGEGALMYFTNYPPYMLVFWILNLGGGLIGPVLYLLKNRYAKIVAFVAVVADFILMQMGIIFRNRISALGMNIFEFDIFILLITFLFWLYLFISYKKEQN